MYSNIMVAVDNSQWSDWATDVAVDLARKMGASLTGTHVYAAQLHGVRFRQVEPGLPEQYQTEEMLRRQRGIHHDLIGRGMGIISDSYLDVFEGKCRQAGLAARRKVFEGRHYVELVRDTEESGYDLVVLGAHGLGRVGRSVLGSVCERVTRLVKCDALVVHDQRPLTCGPLAVALDGSAHSFAALRVALCLSHIYRNRVLAVAAYDPFFHGVAFRSLAGVLSGEAAKLFRFEAQERLHGEIIDDGLATVYRSHLLRAQALAEKEGISIDIRVLRGKPFDAVASAVEEADPSLLLVGRVGLHHEAGVTLGSTAENLLRLAGCNVLVANQSAEKAEPEAVTMEANAVQPEGRWSEEARQRPGRVPLASSRTAVSSLARLLPACARRYPGKRRPSPGSRR